MNAALVCVDYSDLLAVTLPYNRHHFEEVLVVTAPRDTLSIRVAGACNARVHTTDAFTRGGASFNKWLALEEALDAADFRRGWLCLMDADVLWPKVLTVCAKCGAWQPSWRNATVECDHAEREYWRNTLLPGKLYAPLRRLRPELTACPESEWSSYRVHRNVGEWAGYSQVFHCSDPTLGQPPWHELNWKHAGGADSFFQRKWAPVNKVRPPFEVLHLGECATNWHGRTDEGRARTARMWSRRREVGFAEEKL